MKVMTEPEEGRWRPDEDDDEVGGRSSDMTKMMTEPKEGLAT
jgi:hypothetical protein